MTDLSSGQERELRRFVAREAIKNALAVHSRGVDRADLNLLNSAYHPDADVAYGFFTGPAAQFAEILSGAQKQGEITLHRTCNMWIAVDGDQARSESYVMAYCETPEPDGAMQRLIGGRYLDRHALRDGEWRLTHRSYVLDWNINRPSTAAWADPPVSLLLGTPRGGHGEADPGRALLALGAARMQTQGETAMPSIAAEEIDRALSRAALHDLMMGYARGVDRADEDLLRSIFLEDATVVTGAVNGSGAQFATEIVKIVSQNLERCFHSIANEWFDIRGDRAVGESYVIAISSPGAEDIVTGGRYINEFVRRDGVWKIASHTFVCDYKLSLPASYRTDGMYESLTTRGCFGRKDPVYALWNA